MPDSLGDRGSVTENAPFTEAGGHLGISRRTSGEVLAVVPFGVRVLAHA